MPIRFRCNHCHGLMAISTRKAGAIVVCAMCGEETLVPSEDTFTNEEDASEPASAGSVSPAVSEPSWLEQPLAGESPDDGELPAAPHDSEEAYSGENDSDPFIPADLGDDGEDVPMTIRRRRSGDDEMDLTPMVDVTFQLLIFFMVSASFSLQKSIEVPTPDPDQKGATQQVQTLDDIQGTSILVRIDANNSIWIDDEQLADASRLVDTLRDKMRREQKTEMLITAHAQSLHRSIIAVIDAANEIGVQKIRMASHKKTE